MLVPMAPILTLLVLAQAVSPAQRPAPQAPERIRVGLVLIEAAVRDSKDRPVRGLVLSDFELQIDGQPVPAGSIPVFEEICQAERVAGVTADARREVTPQSTAPVAHGDLPAAGHIVVFFDFTALSFSARQLALTAARHFFESRKAPTDQAKILADVGGALLTIQDFTSDLTALKEAVETLARDSTNVDLNLRKEDDQLHTVAQMASHPGCVRVALPFVIAEHARARRSLERLGEAVASLRDIKGRKSVVLISDALRLDPGAQYFHLCRAIPFLQEVNLRGDIEALMSAAEAADVSIHTVHAGGLTQGPETVISSGGIFMGPAMKVALQSAHDLQAILALQTGGRSLKRSNDLGAILVTAQQDHSCLYELGWTPPGEVPDGNRHTISLQLTEAARKGLPRGIEGRHRPFYVDRAR